MCFSGAGNYIWMQFVSRGSSFARLDSNPVPPRGNKIHFKALDATTMGQNYVNVKIRNRHANGMGEAMSSLGRLTKIVPQHRRMIS
jgi:hypothetical protein